MDIPSKMDKESMNKESMKKEDKKEEEEEKNKEEQNETEEEQTEDPNPEEDTDPVYDSDDELTMEDLYNKVMEEGYTQGYESEEDIFA